MDLNALLDDNAKMEDRILSHIGREDCTKLDEDINVMVADTIRIVLSNSMPSYVPHERKEQTPVDVDLLGHWQAAAKDPGDEPPRWLAIARLHTRLAARCGFLQVGA